MAKRKRKRTTQSDKVELKTEIYAVLFILAAIVGLGKLGPVGRLVASFSLFMTGSIYMVFLVFLLILGVYIFIKGEWIDFFSTKFLGFYMLVIGLLSFKYINALYIFFIIKFLQMFISITSNPTTTINKQ